MTGDPTELSGLHIVLDLVELAIPQTGMKLEWHTVLIGLYSERGCEYREVCRSQELRLLRIRWGVTVEIQNGMKIFNVALWNALTLVGDDGPVWG